METCCGYGYELVRRRRSLPRIFKVPPGARGCHENCGTLRLDTKTHSPFERIPGPRWLMQKRQLFPELRWASLGHFALPRQNEVSKRFRYQVPEYGPDSLSALLRFDRSHAAQLIKASPKP